MYHIQKWKGVPTSRPRLILNNLRTSSIACARVRQRFLWLALSTIFHCAPLVRISSSKSIPVLAIIAERRLSNRDWSAKKVVLVVAFDRSLAEFLEIITQINKKVLLIIEGYTSRS